MGDKEYVSLEVRQARVEALRQAIYISNSTDLLVEERLPVAVVEAAEKFFKFLTKGA